jgi:outer membrane protein insertion porin family
MIQLLTLLSLLGLARAEPPLQLPWYVGQPVEMVSLEASDGGLPGENLEPLLNVKQHSLLQPYQVRADLSVLHRVGQFASVEAWVEPWVGYDLEGLPFQAVRLVYRVRPPPRVRRLTVAGPRAATRRQVEAASGLSKGDPFYDEQDVAAVTERLQQFYAREGFPDARVTVHSEAVDKRRVDVELRVEEGAPQLLTALHFVGVPTSLEAAAKRVVTRPRLRVGQRYQRDAVLQAREDLEELLLARGYPEADVRALLAAEHGEFGDAQLSMVVRAGRHVDVRLRGVGAELGLRRELTALVQEQLVGQMSDEILREVEARVQRDLQLRGWRAAAVRVEATDVRGDRLVTVQVDRGPRHQLDRVNFEGAEAFTERYLVEALEEASPEVIGQGWLTDEELRKALDELQEFYRSRGYLDASLEPAEPVQGEPRWLGRVPLTLEVQVREGARTMLRSMELSGQPCPGSEAVLASAPELVDAPFDPSAVDRLAREIAAACWDEGYLDADVTVQQRLEPGGVARVAFLVEPGPLVVLRNTIIQGHAHTRRAVIEREISLVMGEPVTRSGLLETRLGLYDLGLFERVETVLIGDEDRVKDLLVMVEENPRISFDVGGGASTDQGVRAFARATHRNLWGRAHKLSLVGQAGLSYRGDEWALDTTEPEWRAGLRYEAPNIPGDGQRSFLDLLLNEEQQHASYRLARTGGGLGVQTDVGKSGELIMDYRLEWRRIDDVDPGVLLEHDPWLPLLGLPDSPVGAGEGFDPTAWGEPTLPSASRLSSGPGFLLVTDARDDPENPRRGVRFLLEARLEDGALSTVPFVTARSQLQTLLPLGPVGLLLGVQAGIGQVLDVGTTLPLEERFRLGGAGSMRGFERESVGPRNRLEAYDPGYPDEIAPVLEYLRRSDPYRWVATGGDAMLLGTVELKVPFPLLGLRSWDDAALVGFADIGNAFLLEDLVETTSMQEGGEPFLRTGMGVGLRYFTALGPLQLDLGLNPWMIEERDEVPFRLHLSLGTL